MCGIENTIDSTVTLLNYYLLVNRKDLSQILSNIADMSAQEAASPSPRLTLPIPLHVQLEHQQHEGHSQDSGHEQVTAEETRNAILACKEHEIMMVQVSEFVRDARRPRHGADGARGQGAGGAQHRHPDVEPARQHGVQGLMQCSLRVSCDQCLSIGQIWQRKIYQLISKSRLHLFIEDTQQISAKAQLLSLTIVVAIMASCITR